MFGHGEAHRHWNATQYTRSQYDPKIDPANFVDEIDNPYLPLTPGTTYVYKGETDEGLEVQRFKVTHNTVEIQGVTCVEVLDVSWVDGEMVERTRDWFAQDKLGNVWYFGEDSRQFENGKLVSTEGSFVAGVDGAKAGIAMEATPKVGDVYKLEYVPGVAEDTAEVLSLDASANVPYGRFDNVVKTKDFTPLEPNVLEHKFYAPGVGLVQTVDLENGERAELVRIKTDGRSGVDTVTETDSQDGLLGHTGGDEFIYEKGSGRNHMIDFQNDVDDLDLSTFGFSSFKEVKELASDTSAGSMRLDFGDGDVLVVSGFSTADLDRGDVIL